MGFFQKLVRNRTEPMPDAAAVTARMESLVAAGRASDAIDYAQPHAIRLGDEALHRALMMVRRDAVAEACAACRPLAVWPPKLADPFPDVTGVPEITRDALDPATMGGAILHHGSLIVRGLIDRSVAQGLAADVETVFDAWDRWRAGEGDDETARWISPMDLPEGSDPAKGRDWTRMAGGVIGTDTPTMLSRLIELYHQHGLIAAITSHLGERPLLTAGKTVLRRAEPTREADFHQDGAFLGADVRTVNVWLALSDCGIDSPGIELADCRVDTVLETGTEGANFKWSIGREVARRANGGRPFARPEFRAGDVLIFDQVMLHATSWSPEMTQPRYAFESWFFAPSAHPAQQVPLVV